MYEKKNLDIPADCSIIRYMSNNRTISLHGYADMFKALSNPNRLQIFLSLTRCCQPGTVCSTEDIGVRCVGDLGAEVNIAASTLSHHIKELHRAGLIEMRRNGQHVECWIAAQTLKDLSAFFINTQEAVDEPERS